MAPNINSQGYLTRFSEVPDQQPPPPPPRQSPPWRYSKARSPAQKSSNSSYYRAPVLVGGRSLASPQICENQESADDLPGFSEVPNQQQLLLPPPPKQSPPWRYVKARSIAQNSSNSGHYRAPVLAGQSFASRPIFENQELADDLAGFSEVPSQQLPPPKQSPPWRYSRARSQAQKSSNPRHYQAPVLAGQSFAFRPIGENQELADDLAGFFEVPIQRQPPPPLKRSPLGNYSRARFPARKSSNSSYYHAPVVAGLSLASRPICENQELADVVFKWMKMQPVRLHKFFHHFVSQISFEDLYNLNELNIDAKLASVGHPPLSPGPRGKFIKLSKALHLRHCILMKCLKAIQSGESIVIDRALSDFRQILMTPLLPMDGNTLVPLAFQLLQEVSDKFDSQLKLTKKFLSGPFIATCNLIVGNMFFNLYQRTFAEELRQKVIRYAPNGIHSLLSDLALEIEEDDFEPDNVAKPSCSTSVEEIPSSSPQELVENVYLKKNANFLILRREHLKRNAEFLMSQRMLAKL